MAGYTVKNLKEDVEDSATKFGLAPNLEARFAREDLGAEKTGMSYQRFAPGFRTPFGHTHEAQEELYVVVSGSGRIKLDEEIVELKQWDVVRIANDTMRCFEGGSEGAELVIFGAVAAGANDAEMTQGWWSD